MKKLLFFASSLLLLLLISCPQGTTPDVSSPENKVIADAALQFDFGRLTADNVSFNPTTLSITDGANLTLDATIPRVTTVSKNAVVNALLHTITNYRQLPTGIASITSTHDGDVSGDVGETVESEVVTLTLKTANGYVFSDDTDKKLITITVNMSLAYIKDETLDFDFDSIMLENVAFSPASISIIDGANAQVNAIVADKKSVAQNVIVDAVVAKMNAHAKLPLSVKTKTVAHDGNISSDNVSTTETTEVITLTLSANSAVPFEDNTTTKEILVTIKMVQQEGTVIKDGSLDITSAALDLSDVDFGSPNVTITDGNNATMNVSVTAGINVSQKVVIDEIIAKLSAANKPFTIKTIAVTTDGTIATTPVTATQVTEVLDVTLEAIDGFTFEDGTTSKALTVTVNMKRSKASIQASTLDFDFGAVSLENVTFIPENVRITDAADGTISATVTATKNVSPKAIVDAIKAKIDAFASENLPVGIASIAVSDDGSVPTTNLTPSEVTEVLTVTLTPKTEYALSDADSTINISVTIKQDQTQIANENLDFTFAEISLANVTFSPNPLVISNGAGTKLTAMVKADVNVTQREIVTAVINKVSTYATPLPEGVESIVATDDDTVSENNVTTTQSSETITVTLTAKPGYVFANNSNTFIISVPLTMVQAVGQRVPDASITLVSAALSLENAAFTPSTVTIANAVATVLSVAITESATVTQDAVITEVVNKIKAITELPNNVASIAAVSDGDVPTTAITTTQATEVVTITLTTAPDYTFDDKTTSKTILLTVNMKQNEKSITDLEDSAIVDTSAPAGGTPLNVTYGGNWNITNAQFNTDSNATVTIAENGSATYNDIKTALMNSINITGVDVNTIQTKLVGASMTELTGSAESTSATLNLVIKPAFGYSFTPNPKTIAMPFEIIKLGGISNQDTYYVKTDGNDSATGEGEETALKTVQEAVNRIIAHNDTNTGTAQSYTIIVSGTITEEGGTDGNRPTGSNNNDDAIIEIEPSKALSLTIKGSSVGATIDASSNNIDDKYILYIAENTTLTLGNNLTLSNNPNSGVFNRATLIVDGTTISNNDGVGITNHGTGTLQFLNGFITDNNFTGIQNRGTLIMQGGSISGNYAHIAGTSAGVSNSGSAYIRGGSITGNRSRFVELSSTGGIGGAGAMYISGNPVIDENYAGIDKTQNVSEGTERNLSFYWSSERRSYTILEAKLTQGANIGLSIEKESVLAGDFELLRGFSNENTYAIQDSDLAYLNLDGAKDGKVSVTDENSRTVEYSLALNKMANKIVLDLEGIPILEANLSDTTIPENDNPSNVTYSGNWNITDGSFNTSKTALATVADYTSQQYASIAGAIASSINIANVSVSATSITDAAGTSLVGNVSSVNNAKLTLSLQANFGYEFADGSTQKELVITFSIAQTHGVSNITTYYVAEDGSDSRTGENESIALASVQQAVDRIIAHNEANTGSPENYTIMVSGTITNEGGTVDNPPSGTDGSDDGMIEIEPPTKPLTLTIQANTSATIDAQHAKPVVKVGNNSTVTLQGSLLLTKGGYPGVRNSGTLTIDGASITESRGKGLFNDYNSIVHLISGSISNNSDTGVDNRGIFTMSGGSISDNSTIGYGAGGISNSSTTILTGGSITGNTSRNGQGGLDGSRTVISGSIVIKDNFSGPKEKQIDSNLSVGAVFNGPLTDAADISLTVNESSLLNGDPKMILGTRTFNYVTYSHTILATDLARLRLDKANLDGTVTVTDPESGESLNYGLVLDSVENNVILEVK